MKLPYAYTSLLSVLKRGEKSVHFRPVTFRVELQVGKVPRLGPQTRPHVATTKGLRKKKKKKNAKTYIQQRTQNRVRYSKVLNGATIQATPHRRALRSTAHPPYHFGDPPLDGFRWAHFVLAAKEVEVRNFVMTHIFRRQDARQFRPATRPTLSLYRDTRCVDARLDRGATYSS